MPIGLAGMAFTTVDMRPSGLTGSPGALTGSPGTPGRPLGMRPRTSMGRLGSPGKPGRPGRPLRKLIAPSFSLGPSTFTLWPEHSRSELSLVPSWPLEPESHELAAWLLQFVLLLNR